MWLLNKRLLWREALAGPDAWRLDGFDDRPRNFWLRGDVGRGQDEGSQEHRDCLSVFGCGQGFSIPDSVGFGEIGWRGLLAAVDMYSFKMVWMRTCSQRWDPNGWNGLRLGRLITGVWKGRFYGELHFTF
jgi:hypothetical protein